jgi:signal transduction histidine kinase
MLPSSSWPVPPEQAAVVPIRLREESDPAGFLVLGIHPGRAFDDPYRQFVRQIAEQIAIGLTSARAYEYERRRADALAEIDRAKTAFFSNVSHEFRTPLQLMLGPLERLLTEAGERLGREHHQELMTVRLNALRLLKLVNTLLDFSRLEARRVQAVYQPTDLVGLTSNIASMFRSAMLRPVTPSSSKYAPDVTTTPTAGFRHEEELESRFVVQRFAIGEISPMSGRLKPFRFRILRWPADCGGVGERSRSD